MASSDGHAARPLSANNVSRGATVSPKVTKEDVELNNMQNGEAPKGVPLEDDIMQCARLGETGLIQNMFETKKFSPSYRDEEGITPLHVSSIVTRVVRYY